MVVVRVRETYDLHTVQNKMTVIAIHTPKPDIIKKNFPGLLMQCKAYRPRSANVVISCASVLPLDPLGVGTAVGDVAPEDVFNPILYKAISNKGMSQLEARIQALGTGHDTAVNVDIDGNTASIDVDDVTSQTDEFGIYYGLLSNAHGFKTAHPQQGLSMSNLRPIVFDVVANVGDMADDNGSFPKYLAYPKKDGTKGLGQVGIMLGKPKEMPFLNCTSYSGASGAILSGFPNPDAEHGDYQPYNAEIDVPYLNVVCGVVIIPPSRRHELFYRMTISWDIEFSSIRPIGEITDFGGLASLGASTHYQNYSYATAKKSITGDDDSILDNDACMVSSNVEVDKVM